jgi:GT2 family glycosyltransferase
MDGSQITVAISTRNRARLVERFVVPALPALVEAGVPIVVVDQSDTDETARLLERQPEVRVLRSEPGLARAHNVALAATATPLIAFTDDDVSVDPAWVEGILREFEPPEVGAVCGRVVDEDGRLLPGAANGLYRWPANPIGLGTGANIAFRRAALDDAGPFDEELGVGAPYHSAEETDMLYRVMRSGWTVACSDRLTIVHHEWRTAREEAALHYRYGLGAGAQFGKHLAEGDRTAGRLAIIEAGRHGVTLARAVAKLQPRVARLQPPFLAGLAVGFVRRYRAVRSSSGPERPA